MGDNESGVKEALAEVVVLYVEDETEVRELAAKYIGRSVPNLLVAGSGEEALHISENKEVDILITDIMMGNIDGVELATKLKERNPSCYIIFSTAYSNTDRLMQAVDIKVDKYLVKPVDWRELVNTISMYAERVSMMKNLKDEVDDRDADVISTDVYKAIIGALGGIEESIAEMSKSKHSEASIKIMRNLETSRKYLENVLKDYF